MGPIDERKHWRLIRSSLHEVQDLCSLLKRVAGRQHSASKVCQCSEVRECQASKMRR